MDEKMEKPKKCKNCMQQVKRKTKREENCGKRKEWKEEKQFDNCSCKGTNEKIEKKTEKDNEKIEKKNRKEQWESRRQKKKEWEEDDE